MITKDWISIEDKLPPENEYVLIYAGNYSQSVKFDVACINIGITEKDRERMKSGELPDPEKEMWTGGLGTSYHKRSSLYSACDEHGNNLKPYCFSTFGPMTYFGQDVTHWMPLIKPNA